MGIYTHGCVCATGAIAALVAAGPADAALVSGTYFGTVASDSGLGLIGQTMQVDFTYDDAVTPFFTTGSGSSSYTNVLTAATVVIGANVWTWDSAAGFSSMNLQDDNVNTFTIGVEDRFSVDAGTFNGPNLAGEPVSPDSYSLSIALSDNVPAGSPDGLSVETTLPTAAPNPDLFQDFEPFSTNRMQFSFFTGDGEGSGTFYIINTADVSNVPEPGSLVLLSLAAGITVMQRRRPSGRGRAGAGGL